MYLPRPLKLLLAGLLLYVGAYAGLRSTDHLVLYHGRLLYGSWGPHLSLLDPSASNQYFKVGSLPAFIFSPLAKLDAKLLKDQKFNDEAGTTPLQGELSKEESGRLLPDTPEGWTLVGGWFEHLEKGRHESWHAVLRTSADPVAPDSQVWELAHKLAGAPHPAGEPVVAKSQSPHVLGTHTLSVDANVFRATGPDGGWAEITVDDQQMLAGISWGVDK